MPVDFSAPEGAASPQNEDTMFAPTPLWDRQPKTRRGRRAAASRAVRDPAIDAGEAGAGAGVIGATTAAEPADAAYETQPAARGEATPSRRGGVPAGAVAAGVAAVAALAAVGWYASRPHDTGVVELTPGAPATREIALNTAAPPPSAAEAPVTSTPPRPAPQAQPAKTSREPTPTTRTARTATTPRSRTALAAHTSTRVRPAPSDSAAVAGVDASATAPMIATPPPSPSTSTSTTPMGAAVNPAPVNPVIPASPAPTTPSGAAAQPSAPATTDPTVTP